MPADSSSSYSGRRSLVCRAPVDGRDLPDHDGEGDLPAGDCLCFVCDPLSAAHLAETDLADHGGDRAHRWCSSGWCRARSCRRPIFFWRMGRYGGALTLRALPITMGTRGSYIKHWACPPSWRGLAALNAPQGRMPMRPKAIWFPGSSSGRAGGVCECFPRGQW